MRAAPVLDTNLAEPERHVAPVPRITIQAFCESPELAHSVQNAAADRRMARAHVKVSMGGLPAAEEAYRTSATPNVILIEYNGHSNALLEGLDRLAESCDAGTKVVVVGRVNDIILYRELVRRGISDYVVAPLAPLDIVASISGLYGSADAKPVGKIVGVIGAKGGVGASTVAHNIGFAIARDLEIDAVVADLDLAFGTAGLDFNQDPPQGIADAVFSPDRVDAAFVDRLLSKCTDRLSLLAAPATLDREYDISPEAFEPIFDTLRASVPYAILDLPHIWSGWAKRAILGADEIIIVAAPDLANLRNAKNMMDLIRQGRPNDAPPRLTSADTAVQIVPQPRQVAPAAPRPARAKGEWKVQLGAFGVAGNADRLWAKLSGNPALAGTEKLVVSSGKFTRLLASGFASKTEASSACSRLKAQGQGCLVTKS